MTAPIRKITTASFGVLGALILGACSPSNLVDMSIPLRDGQYSAASNADDQGAIGTIDITVEGGKIVEASFTTARSDGTLKDENYGKTRNGEVSNQDYYNRAQWAVESYTKYSEQLVEVQDPTEVDTISGASVAYSQFLQAALRAVYQAQGVEDDGRSDSVNMPSLGLGDEDF